MDNSEYFQGHYLNRVRTVKERETMEVQAGSFIIPTGQPKSNLICYLLEPETDDNLVTWGFLDTFLQAMSVEDTRKQLERRRGRFEARGESVPPGQRIPIYRLMKKTELKGTFVESFNSYERNRFVR
jgi:hypothetical protein